MALDCKCKHKLGVNGKDGKLNFELLPLCLLFLNKGLKSTLKGEILLSYICT